MGETQRLQCFTLKRPHFHFLDTSTASIAEMSSFWDREFFRIKNSQQAEKVHVSTVRLQTRT